MNPTENVAMALFNHLAKTFEQDFHHHVPHDPIGLARAAQMRGRLAPGAQAQR
jgi:hypothetical protein